MKLPINKRDFDQIKAGEKGLEFRDAHLTLVCEETGEHHRVDVTGVILDNKENWKVCVDNPKMFEDDKVIIFRLRGDKVNE